MGQGTGNSSIMSQYIKGFSQHSNGLTPAQHEEKRLPGAITDFAGVMLRGRSDPMV
jgi:hypothetical protein